MKNLKDVILVILIVADDEEPGGHIEVEGDVHHDNHHTAHLQTNSVLHYFFVLKYFRKHKKRNVSKKYFVP